MTSTHKVGVRCPLCHRMRTRASDLRPALVDDRAHVAVVYLVATTIGAVVGFLAAFLLWGVA